MKPLNYFFGSDNSTRNLVLSAFCLLVQLVALGFTFFVGFQSFQVHWSLGLGLLLVSFGWWECFVPERKWVSLMNYGDSR